MNMKLSVKKDKCSEKYNRSFYRATFKKFVVNRNCLTQTEHLELLATAKGYSWEETRKRSYVQELRKRSEELRGHRHIKPRKDKQAMWREFVNQFLLTSKYSLSPMMKAKLSQILMAQNMTDPKWSTNPNPPVELCRFFRNLKPQCDSNKWRRDFKKTLSSLIFDYIVYIRYFDQMTEEKKAISSEILKKLKDITQEHGFPQPSPENYLEELQIFMSEMLAPWLSKSTADFCKDVNTDKNSVINNNYDEQLPNKGRTVRNDSNRKYFRPSDKKQAVKFSVGHKSKIKTDAKRKSNRTADVSDANDKKSANKTVIEITSSKANDGLIKENESKIKNLTKTARKTKRNHGDAVVMRNGPNEEDVETESVRNVRKKTKSSGVRKSDGELKTRSGGLKKRHERIAGRTTEEKSRTSVDEKLESLTKYDEVLHGSNDNNVIIGEQQHSANEKSKEIDKIRIGKHRENNKNAAIATHRRKNGEMKIGDKSDDKVLNVHAIKRDKSSNGGAKSKTRNGVKHREDKSTSKSKIRKRRELSSESKPSISSKAKGEESNDETNGRFDERNEFEHDGNENGSTDEKPLLESSRIDYYDNNNTASFHDNKDVADKSIIADNANALDGDDTEERDDSCGNDDTDIVVGKSKTDLFGNDSDAIDTDRESPEGIVIAVISDKNDPYEDNTQYLNEGNTQYLNEDNAQYVNEGNTQYPNEENTQYPNENNSQYLNEGNTQYLNEDNAQYVNEGNTQYPNEENTQYPNENNTQYVNEGNTQYPNEDNTQYVNEDNTQSSTAHSSEEDELEYADHPMSYTRGYNDTHNDGDYGDYGDYGDDDDDDEFTSFDSSYTNEFFNKSSTKCNDDVRETLSDMINRITDHGCYERFVKSARKAMADEMKNKESTDVGDCDNLNPGIKYRICKNEGSDYSIHKTILPVCKNSDLINPGKKCQCKKKSLAGGFIRRYVLNIETGELVDMT